MRLLAQQGSGFSLDKLPFSERDADIIKRNTEKPWGMILATGPTGSGKTTTLYAILKVLNTRTVNISTIEDPVEYDIAGINQIQVNPRTNLTFAHGLRSILRQDPNIIMVGEIRDEETAGIAVNASLTGHLVLSTLHTNDAATTLPRLLDMGIEPFLIASTINIAIGQRLVRALCPKCKKLQTLVTEQLPKEILHVLSVKARQTLGRSMKIFTAGGCTACHQTGYKSRIGIYEVLEMDEALRKLVMVRATADDIRTQSRASGMTTLVEDGMRKVIAGLTSVEEILRVTKE
jgi:type II secretory ATPase GspE/PulE/Tfp pilus assembly ATPase PilB-like protein